MSAEACPRDQFSEMINLLSEQNRLMAVQEKHLASLASQVSEQGRMLEVVGRSVLREILADVDRVIQDRQYSMMETMEQLSSGKSVARWGDGEVRLMVQPEFELSFQKPDQKLARELRGILENYDAIHQHTLLAMPTVYPSRLWMGIWADSWHILRPILEASTSKWANTHISRPLFFQKHGRDAVDAWRQVWQNKSVCVIAGKGSRFELLPALFDNVKDVSRIDSLPRNAFDDFEALKRSLAESPHADVYLIALGPTGTALAAYLSSAAAGGHHAIDIGHLASSYINVFSGGVFPEQAPLVR